MLSLLHAYPFFSVAGHTPEGNVTLVAPPGGALTVHWYRAAFCGVAGHLEGRMGVHKTQY